MNTIPLREGELAHLIGFSSKIRKGLRGVVGGGIISSEENRPFIEELDRLRSSGDYVVNFAANQTLPPGYTVQWWESDEMYRWVLSEDVYGVEHWDRFRARRDAWAHYRANNTDPHP